MTPGAVEEIVTILRLAGGGDGVGRLADGRAVFVPRGAPGDVVRLRDVRRQRKMARARVAEILTPGPGRVAPRCHHYVADACGGCQLQHLDEDTQQAARRMFVGEALRRIGKIDVADPPLELAPNAWAYRSRVTLTVLPGRSGVSVIGFHRSDRPEEVFDLQRCEILHPSLQAVWDAVRLCRGHLPPSLDRIVLRLDRQGGAHLVLHVTDPRVWAGGTRLAEAMLAKAAAVTVWWQPPEGAARVLSGVPTAFPVTVFEQVHPIMGDRVRAYALDQLRPSAVDHVWDLYAGVGESTTGIRAAGATVESVEQDPHAVGLASRGESRPDASVLRHIGRVELVLLRLRPPDAVLTNPPRTGMDARVTEGLHGSTAKRIVYVSCDPATLARDLSRLGPGWRLADLRAFDLFPQTSHIETVATLERSA